MGRVEVDTLATMFKEEIKKAMALTTVSTVVTGENVYQEGNDKILPILDEMAASLMLPGSGVDGMENFEELLAKAESGKSCLLLVEHYSNFDLSIVSLLVRQAGGRGNDIAKAIIAIAGMKLNEDNPIVAAFASAYTRIVIYPNRSLKGLDPEKKQAELSRSFAINRAAMKAVDSVKTQGRLILLFPAGTRYRSWDPSTKKGVREIDTYLRSFDYMCCVALNGEILQVQQTDMLNDVVTKDVVRVTAGPVHSCAEFRSRAQTAATIEDKKQASVDAIMAELEQLHITAEEKRKNLINGGKND
jgi:glycerol-3-phosphate O-acyltransferase